MIDGLKQENYLGGSVFSDFVSGINLQFSTATIPTITANTGLTALASIKAGSAALGLGSAVITFGTAFPNANYHVVISSRSPAQPNAAAAIATGSYAAGSFMAIGSLLAGTDTFNWLAIARSS